MTWVGRDLKYFPVPPLCHGQGRLPLDQVALFLFFPLVFCLFFFFLLSFLSFFNQRHCATQRCKSYLLTFQAGLACVCAQPNCSPGSPFSTSLGKAVKFPLLTRRALMAPLFTSERCSGCLLPSRSRTLSQSCSCDTHLYQRWVAGRFCVFTGGFWSLGKERSIAVCIQLDSWHSLWWLLWKTRPFSLLFGMYLGIFRMLIS